MGHLSHDFPFSRFGFTMRNLNSVLSPLQAQGGVFTTFCQKGSVACWPALGSSSNHWCGIDVPSQQEGCHPQAPIVLVPSDTLPLMDLMEHRNPQFAHKGKKSEWDPGKSLCGDHYDPLSFVRSIYIGSLWREGDQDRDRGPEFPEGLAPG